MASFFSRSKSISKPKEARPRIDPPDSATTANVAPSSNVLINAYKSAFGASPTTSSPTTSPRAARNAVEGDPISLHLLTETALADSDSYTILTPEAVDGLKRQLDTLGPRIEATRRKLVLESKVRDAATSINKLDRASGGSSSMLPDESRESARKCEELGRELWEMEGEERRLRQRLLEHTAGVLQMTHKGQGDGRAPSLTTGASLADDEEFGEWDMTKSGFYRPYNIEGWEDGIMDVDFRSGGGKGGASSAELQKQQEIIAEVESKAERLNEALRDTMSKMDEQAQLPARPRLTQGDRDNAVDNLTEQMSSLERGLTSIQAKVQALHNQNMALQEQKDVLTRQVQQQRELNASSDEVKDKKIADMSEELFSLRDRLEVTEQEARVHLEKLNDAAVELATARGLVSQQQGIAAQHQKTTAALDEATSAAAKAEAATQHLEGEVVRLQTELTMAKAELDGAYGSRAQRAAEAAADPVLTARVQTLERELSETIGDYEAMTKATIEYEKERETLEGTIDGLRDKVEQLETTLSEERISAMGGAAGGQGSRTPSTPMTEGGRSGGTSAGVLKAEFKKMMRETKAEHARRLREEQEERRKLESIIRSLKKEQISKAPVTAAAG